MNRISLALILATLVAFASTSAAIADDDPQSLFNALFKQQVDDAMASRDGKDNAQVATALLDAAKSSLAHKQLVALLCDKAYLVAAADAENYGLAAQALDLKIEHKLGDTTETFDKLVLILRKQFAGQPASRRSELGTQLIKGFERAASHHVALKDYDKASSLYRQGMTVARSIKSELYDTLRAAFDDLQEQRKTQERIASLQTKIELKPGDTKSVHELIHLYAIELDQPQEAESYLLLVKDADLKRRVTLAAKPLGKIEAEDLMDLGDWYREQAGMFPNETITRRALSRALAYYQGFIKLHGTEDLTGKKGQLLASAVERSLVRLGGPIETSLDSNSTVANTQDTNTPEPAETITIPANSEKGYSLGPVNAGTKLQLNYVSGKWKGWGGSGDINPDKTGGRGGLRCRLAIVAFDKSGQSQLITLVPEQTANRPFTFELKSDVPELVLRINDGDNQWTNNPGKVQYQLKVEGKVDYLHGMNETVANIKSFGKRGKMGSVRWIKVNGTDLDKSMVVYLLDGKPATLTYTLDKKYKVLAGGVAVQEMNRDPYSPMTARILGDGKELWTSKPLAKQKQIQPFQVNIDGVAELQLEVTCVGKSGFCALVWVEPELHTSKATSSTAIIRQRTGRNADGKNAFFGIPID